MTKSENENDKKEKFCYACGHKIKREDKFCEICGANLDNVYEDDEGVSELSRESSKESIADVKELEDNKEVKEKKKFKNVFFKKKDNSIKMEKIRNNKFVTIFISSLITLLICMLFTVVYCKYFVSTTSTNSSGSTTTKNVTITDTGIAAAVSKVYDAVVVVKTYVNGQLYATGTGFVYKTDDNLGYILTNNHVISEGTEIKVVFTNNKEVTAKVVGKDDYSDIAVLSVAKSNVISVATIGSSEKASVGDTTFAVGAPIDSSVYSWTVTRGILSGKNRLVEVSDSSDSYSSSTNVMEVLQTDTSINSGNSGGPLCNANGEVIGITNMKISSSSVEGMGFAIPIETAVDYADKFISGEAIVRPYLGISMYDLSDVYGSSSTATGVYVASVASGSPADKAGLQKGDIITKIGDTSIQSSSYLKYALYKYNIGDKVVITYERNGKTSTTTVTLGSKDSN